MPVVVNLIINCVTTSKCFIETENIESYPLHKNSLCLYYSRNKVLRIARLIIFSWLPRKASSLGLRKPDRVSEILYFYIKYKA